MPLVFLKEVFLVRVLSEGISVNPWELGFPAAAWEVRQVSTLLKVNSL